MNEPLRYTTQQASLVVDALLKRAGQARLNSARFFEFVMREETSRERIKLAAHQALVFKFIQHYPRCVLRMPPGFSKTYILAAEGMHQIGKDPTARGAVVSSSQGQAMKPLAMVRDYIETSRELRLVFPKLTRSSRASDPWTQTKIVVERPRGIRDPSLVAVGVHGKLPGSRLSWILVDDILTEENTATPEGREAVAKWFFSSVLSRRDARKSRVVVANTPWHPDDLTFQLEHQGWPTLAMDAWGNVVFTNADDFDCEDIRPSEIDLTHKAHRLTAHDSVDYAPELAALEPEERHRQAPEGWEDTLDQVYLWPEKYGEEAMEEKKTDYADRMHVFHMLFSMRTRDEQSAKMKVAWIEACKKRARDAGIFTFAAKWDGRAFTGVDVAIGKKRKNDRSAVFTFGLMDDGSRRLLKLESHRWTGKELIGKIIEHRDAFGSIIRVENNAAQDFVRQWALDVDRSLPVRGAHTGANKHSKEHGVESLFVEFENAAWLVPNDPSGRVDPAVQRWLDAMLYYNPEAHTGDELMAAWLARCEAVERGVLKKKSGAGARARNSAATAGISSR